MERSVKRHLRNEAYIYTAVLLIFSGIEAARREYWIAGVMALAALALLGLDIAVSRQRVKGIAANVQTAVDNLSKTYSVTSPWPVAEIRLSDGEILWHNRQLQKALNTVESRVGERITSVFPDLRLDWIQSGKIECPDEQQIRERRFRCLGFIPRQEPGLEPVAQLIWVDSTDLLETRDEFVRSRPVVSIILIDNYDEKYLFAPSGDKIDVRFHEVQRGLSVTGKVEEVELCLRGHLLVLVPGVADPLL